MNAAERAASGLTKSIKSWQIGVGVYVVVIFAGYLFWFVFALGSGVSQKVDAWGQAGDFFGGMLNPVVALAAFFWLTKGVLLQKEELTDAKTAMRQQVQISAVTALISALNEEQASLRQQKDSIEPELKLRLREHNRWQEELEVNESLSMDEETFALLEESNSLEHGMRMLGEQRLEYLDGLKKILSDAS